MFGWSWSANKRRDENSRFSYAFTGILIAATGIAVLGFDPLRLTMISVALTVIVMPLIVLPFLVLMNDRKFVKDRTNTSIDNGMLACLTLAGALFALVVIPLEIFGG